MGKENNAFSLYGDVEFLTDELAELKERGDPSSLDMKIELVLMRSFASKLLKSLGAKFDAKAYIGYFADRKKLTPESSHDKWDTLVKSDVVEDMRDFINYNFSDARACTQLMKALVEIKNLIKIINESNERQIKRIDEGAFGDFCVGAQKKIEDMMKQIGGRETNILKFRKWFGKYIKKFQSMNLK